VGNKSIPEPKYGVDEEFDSLNKQVSEAKKRIFDYVDEVKKTFCAKA